MDFSWWYEGSPREGTLWRDYTGTIRTNDAGTYTFLYYSDDDGYLYVDGKLVSADAGWSSDPRGRRVVIDTGAKAGRCLALIFMGFNSARQ